MQHYQIYVSEGKIFRVQVIKTEGTPKKMNLILASTRYEEDNTEVTLYTVYGGDLIKAVKKVNDILAAV